MPKLAAPDLTADANTRIERFVRQPAEWPVGLQRLATADLPSAADNPGALLYDDTIDRIVYSNGTSWLELQAPGGQIVFPATQNASSDPNTLDDYEEGEWTPVLKFGGGSTGITYTYQKGRYTKIGRLVHVQAYVVLTNKGSSTGTASVGGLPFTSENVAGNFSWTGSVNCNNMSGLDDTVAALTVGATEITLSDNFGGARFNLTEANFTNTTDFAISMTYNV